MSFHKKALIAYIAANLALIVLGYFQLYAAEPTLVTDRDLALNGVSRTVWPVISLFVTALLVTAAYVLRWLWLLRNWYSRRSA